GDGDRLLERAELHRQIDLKVAAGAQQDALAARDREAGQLRRHRKGAGRQIDEPVLAGGISHGDAWTEEDVAGCSDGDAGQRTALTVAYGSSKAAIPALSQ